MPLRTACAMVLAGLAMVACGVSAAPDSPATASAEWRIGFWAWAPSWSANYRPPRGAPVPDDVYVESAQGRVSKAALPPAGRYWMLWRLEGAQGPLARPETADGIAYWFGRTAHAPVGVQIDFDCPTSRLHEYAGWLATLRRGLPAGTRLSITALLDWFRPDTKIAEVLSQVDEFVPQFYDAQLPAGSGMTVGEPVDASRWAPAFNRYKTPYKIGISAFGRIRVDREAFLLASSLLDVVSSPALLPPAVETTPALERRLTFRARARTTIGWHRIDSGDVIEAVLPTRDSVAKAYTQARAMGGYCTGVVFFRWPTDSETLVLSPAEVSRAIGATVPEAVDRVEPSDGDCAAVRCTDLYLLPSEQFPAEARAIALKSSVELEYFLPNPKVARLVSLAPRDTVTVRLPASHGETRLYLGRAVSKATPQFGILGGSR